MKITFTQSICTPDYVYNATLELLSLVKTCHVNHTTWTIWTRSKTLIKYYRLTEIPFILSKSQKHLNAVAIDYLNFCLNLGDTLFFLYLARKPGHAVIIWHLNLSRSAEECWWAASSSLNLFLVRFSVMVVLALLPIFLRNVGCPFPFGSCLFLLNPLI